MDLRVGYSRFVCSLFLLKNRGGIYVQDYTWAGVVPVYIEQGEEAAREWLRTVGRENIEGLDAVLSQTATSWLEK